MSRLGLLSACLALTSLAIGSAIAESHLPLSPQVDGAFQDQAIVVDVTPEQAAESGGPVWWQAEIERTGTDYLRVHFNKIRVGDVAFTLHIADRSGRIVDTIDGAKLREMQEYWSGVISGSYALVSVVAPTPPDVGFEIDGIAYQRRGAVSLSITGADDRQHVVDFSDNPLIRNVSKPVAKLSFIHNGLPSACSGFLISSDLLMTNHHCVADQETCDTATAIFGYEYGPDGQLPSGKQYRCVGVEDADYDLDYAVIRLDGSPGLLWGRLEFSDNDVTDNQDIMIIQHPAGEPKQVSVVGCLVTVSIAIGRAPDTDFAHVCDTMGGSSGSPVLDIDGKVAGLHHYGFGQGLYWDQNRAVRAQLIRASFENR